MINEEKTKYNETLRAMEAQKREILQIIDNERLRTSSMMQDTKDSIMLIANDRIDRARDETLNKIRDLERVSFSFLMIKIYKPNTFVKIHELNYNNYALCP